MKEIVERLTETRQIERAKSILESNGYNISKKLKESLDTKGCIRLSDLIEDLRGDDTEELEFAAEVLGADPEDIYYCDTEGYNEDVYYELSDKFEEERDVPEFKDKFYILASIGKIEGHKALATNNMGMYSMYFTIQ